MQECCYAGILITKTRLFKYIENFTTKKNWKFSDKNSDIFMFSYFCWGCSNEYLQSMFLNRNNVYPYKPQFYYIKVGFKRGQNCIDMFSWCENFTAD